MITKLLLIAAIVLVFPALSRAQTFEQRVQENVALMEHAAHLISESRDDTCGRRGVDRNSCLKDFDAAIALVKEIAKETPGWIHSGDRTRGEKEYAELERRIIALRAFVQSLEVTQR